MPARGASLAGGRLGPLRWDPELQVRRQGSSPADSAPLTAVTSPRVLPDPAARATGT